MTIGIAFQNGSYGRGSTYTLEYFQVVLQGRSVYTDLNLTPIPVSLSSQPPESSTHPHTGLHQVFFLRFLPLRGWAAFLLRSLMAASSVTCSKSRWPLIEAFSFPRLTNGPYGPLSK